MPDFHVDDGRFVQLVDEDELTFLDVPVLAAEERHNATF